MILNEYNLYDRWWNPTRIPDYRGEFFEVGESVESGLQSRIGEFSNNLYQLVISPQKDVKQHSRQVYTVFNFIGELGGAL